MPAPPAPAHGRSAPANRHGPRPEACGARSDPDQDCASSPAKSAGSVQSLPKSCQNDRRWACIRWMLASDVSVGSSVGNPNLSDVRSSPHGIYMPAFPPNRGNPAVRNDREGRENDGIIRSPCSRLDSTRLRGGGPLRKEGPFGAPENTAPIHPLERPHKLRETPRFSAHANPSRLP